MYSTKAVKLVVDCYYTVITCNYQLSLVKELVVGKNIDLFGFEKRDGSARFTVQSFGSSEETLIQH